MLIYSGNFRLVRNNPLTLKNMTRLIYLAQAACQLNVMRLMEKYLQECRACASNSGIFHPDKWKMEIYSSARQGGANQSTLEYLISELNLSNENL